ncbi:universal stress protein [Nocardia sp. NPDC056000]|uniref:universal stress protein n=1 Tax=Nocardia sp. NPDC056000 TaxID=3345674 RepID=UPI0035D7CA7C
MSLSRNENPHLLASAPVVVGVDGTPEASHAVAWAAHTASARERELRIVHGTNLEMTRALLGSYSVVNQDVVLPISQHGEELVAAARQVAEKIDPDLRISTEVSPEHPARLLIEHSATAHMVVIGGPEPRRGLNRLGSILLSVSSHSRGAVVTVRSPAADAPPPSSGPVVVGVDGSPVSEAAIEVAFQEAALRGAPLVAVHAWSDLYLSQFSGIIDTSIEADQIAEAERSLLVERLAGYRENYPEVEVTRDIHLADPRDHLLTWSDTAQLLVVGSRGRGGFTGMLLGSTSNALVQQANCPVMVVHPD